MSNNLKFRAYDTKRKEWCFGFDILGGFSLIGEVVLMGELNRYSLEELCDTIKLMQWTGLQDKNGFDIYFGDILRGPFATGMYGKSVRRKLFNFEVKHYVNKHSGVTYITSMPKDYGNYRFCPYITECEVVGNIHENIELLNQ